MNKWRHKLNKSICALLAALLMVSLLPVVPAYAASGNWSSYTAASLGGGSGDSQNPYLISTAEQLAYLAQRINAGDSTYNSKHYRLTANIDISAHYWTPIGGSVSFGGTFDGGGFIINGLTINSTASNFAGLFGNVSGTVKNLGVTNISINASMAGVMYCGGIAGFIGTITNCYATGSVKGSSSNTNAAVGGIAGYSGGTVKNCYSTCTVTGTGGGSGAASLGSLVGWIGAGAVTYSYWNTATTGAGAGSSGSSCGTGCAGRTAANMQNEAFANTLNINAASNAGWARWAYKEGNYPSFRTFTITYNANSGNLGAVPEAQRNCDIVGATYNVAGQRPMREGYAFLGWSADSGADTAEYQPGATYTNNADVTLYAVWEAIDAPSASPKTSALRETSADDGSFSDTQTITLTNGTFDAGITKFDVIIGNLPDGLDYAVTRIDETSIEISFTMNAAEHSRSFSVSNVTVNVAAGKITGLDGIPTTTNITCGSFALVFIEKGLDYEIFEGGSLVGEHSDVNVQAKVTGDSSGIYKIDIAWGAMKFEYSTGEEWNPDTHSYDGGPANRWLHDGFNGENNKITTTNHSNGDVLVDFAITENHLSVNMIVNQTNSLFGERAVKMVLGKVPTEGADAPSIDAYLWIDRPNNAGVLKESYEKVGVITVTIETAGEDRTPKN